MNVRLDISRHVKVHDVSDAFDVETTGSYVSREHQRLLSFDERGKGLVALMLLLIAVDSDRPKFSKITRTNIHPAFCVGENNDTRILIQLPPQPASQLITYAQQF